MKSSLTSIGLVVSLLLGGLTWYFSTNFALGLLVFVVLILPAVIVIYIPYAKDNPRHLWFKRKLYGWGWTPVSWQGWMITLVYVALIVAFAFTLNKESPPQEIAFTFILPVILLTITFIRIAYMKGEKPRWQWGIDKKNSSE